MQAFTRIVARACPLPMANIDTDQLIPARFMKRSRAAGYGGFLLYDLRFDGQGGEKPDFPLNQSRHAKAAIIVAGANFGTGSSREAAVYALWDYGISCVIAPSFGDIFASNAVKNGLLPAIVSARDLEDILSYLAKADVPDLGVDLENLMITAGSSTFALTLDPSRRLQLLKGQDDLDMTLQHVGEIASYRANRLIAEPWLWPQDRR